MTEYFKEKTLGLRHGIVKILAPGMYQDALKYNGGRPMDYFLKEYFGTFPLVGVEVGVWQGYHAKQILNLLNLNKLYLVDHYLPFAEGKIVYSTEQVERNFEIAKARVSNFNRVTFLKMDSVEATNEVPNELDFVYIDANHTFKGVQADLEAWFPKIRVGGVFGGHDFSVDFQSVIRAVINFAYKTDAKLYFKNPDWWIIKGEPNVEFFK